MADNLTPEERSKLMKKVRQKNTKPEILTRKYLFSKGFRYKINDKNLPGSPDIVLPKYKTAVFVHGCYWHNHKCRAGRIPTSNVDFWQQKMERNKKRDERKINQLIEAGWKVVVVWECGLKKKD